MANPEAIWGDGYVKVPRSVWRKDHIAGYELSEREARTDLRFLVNHNERGGLPKGCCDPSLSFLAERWSWTRSRVVRFLKRLEKEKVITREKSPGRKRTVTRFLAYDPPNKGDTVATQSRGRPRYREAKHIEAFAHPTRHSAVGAPDTVPGPNRTKRVGSARKEEVREKKACPSCWETEIDSHEDACNRCLGHPVRETEIANWQPEDRQ